MNSFEDHLKLQSKIIERQEMELINTDAIKSETLSKLNVSIEALPHKCQQLLEQVATNLRAMDIEQLDSIAFSLQQSRALAESLEDEYEILKLQQKNKELQVKIDRNNKFLENLRTELENSKKSLAMQSPNPENIHEHILQMRIKVASYGESCEKAKAKFTKLSVPTSIYPKALVDLAGTLANLKVEAQKLQERADDILFTREARETFNRLRRL